MFNNISCEKFRQDIDNVINNCALPPVVAYYILKDSLHELEGICKEVIEYESKNSIKQEHEENVDLLDQQTKQILEKSDQLLKEAE